MAIAGGTNSGKSTVFNLLLSGNVSPVRTTAAATRHPVLAANTRRAAQCLDSMLVPEFEPRLLEDPNAALNLELPARALFVTPVASLPDRLVLLDTPDMDSIARENWVLAENIRDAGDVVIAVLTGEKYLNDRVVAFSRWAQASGRVVIPLMNKADPADSFAVARQQLREFCFQVGLETPCFVLPHDFHVLDDFNRPIQLLDGMTGRAGDRPSLTLREHLESLDVPRIKERVYRETIRHMAEDAGGFLDHARGVGQSLRMVADEFRSRAKTYAREYDPVPSTEIGELFHEFVRAKRGPLRRFIGSTSSSVLRGTTSLAQHIAKVLAKRGFPNRVQQAQREKDIHQNQLEALKRTTRSLAMSYVESIHTLREPAAHLLADKVCNLDIDTVAGTVASLTLCSNSVSAEFREHAVNVMQTWWDDPRGKRRILEMLGASLTVAPTAIAVPMSVLTRGWGLPGALLIVEGLVEQVVARRIEYNFADAMFDFLAPWHAERQAAFEQALLEHLCKPLLEKLERLLEAFEGEGLAKLQAVRAKALQL